MCRVSIVSLLFGNVESIFHRSWLGSGYLSTEYSRYKHVVRTRGNMLVTNIFLSQEIIG